MKTRVEDIMATHTRVEQAMPLIVDLLKGMKVLTNNPERVADRIKAEIAKDPESATKVLSAAIHLFLEATKEETKDEKKAAKKAKAKAQATFTSNVTFRPDSPQINQIFHWSPEALMDRVNSTLATLEGTDAISDEPFAGYLMDVQRYLFNKDYNHVQTLMVDMCDSHHVPASAWAHETIEDLHIH